MNAATVSDDHARATLVAAIARARYQTRTRGDDLVALHDAAAGRRIADQAKATLADQVAQVHDGDVATFCKLARTVVPSAYPSRLRPVGMRSQDDRTALRAGDIEHWGWARLCAVADTLGHDVVVTLVPRRPG